MNQTEMYFKLLFTDAETKTAIMEEPLRCKIRCCDLMTISTLLITLIGDEKLDVKLRDSLGVELNEIISLTEYLNSIIVKHLKRSLES